MYNAVLLCCGFQMRSFVLKCTVALMCSLALMCIVVVMYRLVL